MESGQKPLSEIILETKFLWPKQGDRLLKAAKGLIGGASFAANERTRSVLLWEGYMAAASTLVAKARGSSADEAILIYPILFNYRHALELALKWTIDCYGRYANVSLSDSERHHNLWQLWKLCKKVIIELSSTGEDDVMRAVEQVIKDFHDLDSAAMALRYSTDKKRNLYALPNGWFDLDALRDVMEAVQNFFTGVDGELDSNTSAADW